jgi:hypothetical protein
LIAAQRVPARSAAVGLMIVTSEVFTQKEKTALGLYYYFYRKIFSIFPGARCIHESSSPITWVASQMPEQATNTPIFIKNIIKYFRKTSVSRVKRGWPY